MNCTLAKHEEIAWIRDELQDAAENGCRAGLHGLQDQYRQIVGARVRAKARVLREESGVDPASARARVAGMTQRRDTILAGLKTRYSDPTAMIFGSGQSKVPSGWRPVVTIALVFCLCGLLRHERSLEAWAMLVLGAGLTVLVFQSVPALLRVVVESSVLAIGLLRDAASLIAIDYRLDRLDAALAREEALRQRSEQWIDETIALLLAEYEHNKNIAIRARAVA